jgi:hypothetical protein
LGPEVRARDAELNEVASRFHAYLCVVGLEDCEPEYLLVMAQFELRLDLRNSDPFPLAVRD